MSRLDCMLGAFRRDRVQFVIIGLVIVFLGVYGAFALQDFSQQHAVDAERVVVYALNAGLAGICCRSCATPRS